MNTPRYLVLTILAAAAMVPAAAAVESTAVNPTDEEVSREIHALLSRNYNADADGVEVITKSGTVTLSGTVDNYFTRHQMGTIVAEVMGVTRVVNRLDIAGEVQRDEDVRENVLWLLANDPATAGQAFDVAVSNGVVTVTGTADSKQTADLAAIVAAGVNGVRLVENKVAVNPSMSRERPAEDIRREIERRLVANSDINARDIAIHVADGAVTLTGTVGSAYERTMAESLAWVSGVNDVEAGTLNVNPGIERIIIERDGLTNDALVEDIQLALLYEPRVNAFDIDVAVNDGVATLTGTVDNLMASRAAERAARDTRGIYAVDNQIVVAAEEITDNRAIAESIERRIALDPVLTGESISVAVSGNKAILAGDVDSRYERERAVLIAARQRGINHIENRITVEPEPRSDSAIADAIRAELTLSPYVDAADIQVSVDGGVATLTGDVSGWSELEAAIENAYEGGANRVVSNLLVAGAVPERVPYQDTTYETFRSPRWLEF